MTVPEREKGGYTVEPDHRASGSHTTPHNAVNNRIDLQTDHVDEHARRVRLWINWLLALLTLPGAGVVWVFAIAAVMKTAGCTDDGAGCRHFGPGEFYFRVLVYILPAVVALLTIAVSFATASRRRGFLVPLCGLAILAADIAILAVTFRP